MKNCAYCGSNELVTKEHIWPRSLIEKYEGLVTYNPKNNKFYSGDPIVKDVCATCNNVHLSKLDSHLSSLFDRYLFRIVEPSDSATLEYDYELLLRSLLKISYNSSRSANSEKNTKAHSKFSKYILHGNYCPPIMLRLQIVTASRKLNLDDGTDSDFRPEHLRCAAVAYDGPLSHRFLVKMVAINSHWFYMIIPHKKEARHKWNEFIEGFSNWTTLPGVVVEPNKKVLKIPANKTTFFHPNLLGSLATANYGQCEIKGVAFESTVIH